MRAQVREIIHHGEVARIQAGEPVQCMALDTHSQIVRAIQMPTEEAKGAGANATDGRRRLSEEASTSTFEWVFVKDALDTTLELEVLHRYARSTNVCARASRVCAVSHRLPRCVLSRV